MYKSLDQIFEKNQVVTQAVLRDQQTLSTSQNNYRFFPSAPTGAASNYQNNPFPANETIVGAFSARLSQSAIITRAQLAALQGGKIEVSYNNKIVAKAPLERALGAVIAAANDGTDVEIVPSFEGQIKFARPVTLTRNEQLEVNLSFSDASGLPAVALYIDLDVFQVVGN